MMSCSFDMSCTTCLFIFGVVIRYTCIYRGIRRVGLYEKMQAMHIIPSSIGVIAYCSLISTSYQVTLCFGDCVEHLSGHDFLSIYVAIKIVIPPSSSQMRRSRMVSAY